VVLLQLQSLTGYFGAMIDRAPFRSSRTEGYLTGQLLIAMPGMEDERFQRSIIYLCAHSDDGAMGLIINQSAPGISFLELLQQLELIGDDEASLGLDAIPVHVGGPVETGRGFVLHTSDYGSADSTLEVDDGLSLTATIDILKAMAEGEGPEHALLTLGYSGWAPGQLESEIQANGWLHCASDLALIFETDAEDKYDRALLKLGIHPMHLMSEAGHA